MNDIEIGKRIEQRRLEMGLTGGELAKRLGVSAGHLSRVINGKAGSLSVAKARAWASELGVTTQWLMEGQGPELGEAYRRLASDKDVGAALVKLGAWFATATGHEQEMFRHNMRLWSEQLSRRDVKIRNWTINDVVDMERSVDPDFSSWTTASKN